MACIIVWESFLYPAKKRYMKYINGKVFITILFHLYFSKYFFRKYEAPKNITSINVAI